MGGDNNSYYREILDAIPIMVFVVDADVRIHDINRAALDVFGAERNGVLMQRGGHVMHCIHAQDVPEGCGRGPACPDCLIRNSVTACLQGQTVTRRRVKTTLAIGEVKRDFELLITATPMPSHGEPRVLLALEDISELSTLHDIIPICMKCKGIRDDQDYWQSVEQYFNRHIGVEFSHGLCPKCATKYYPEWAQDPKAGPKRL